MSRQNLKKPTEIEVSTDNAKCERFSFFDPNHSVRLLSCLSKQRTDGQFLDVTVTVGDVHIRAHRSVLSAFSRYFEALFSSSMDDSNLDVVPLQDISGEAVKLLIDFAYSGSLEITPENVQDLLFTSNYLCIDSVIDACCSYLVQNLSVENCIDIHELACTLGRDTLKSNVESFMILHFGQLLQEGQFLRMKLEILMALLEKDGIIMLENSFPMSHVEQEKKIADAILRYVDEKPKDRYEHLMLLLSRGIRLLLLPSAAVESMKKSIDKNDYSPESVGLLNRILLSEMSSEERERWGCPRYFMEYESTKLLAYASTVTEEATAEPFDDRNLFSEGQCFFVVGMRIHLRLWYSIEVIGGVEVFYNTGHSVLHGSNDYEYDQTGAEFHLGKDERITYVYAQAGSMIDQLQFRTNKGNIFGPYGGYGGDKEHFKCPCEGAYLAYISGTVVETDNLPGIRKLRFIWAVPKRWPERS